MPQTLTERLTLRTTVLFPIMRAASRPASAYGKNGILARAGAEEVISC